MSIDNAKYLYVHSSKSLSIFEEGDNTILYINGVEFIKEQDDRRTLPEIATEKKRKYYQEYFKRQFKNFIVLSGAGTSIGIGSGDVKGLSMKGLWDEAKSLLGKEFDTLCKEVKQSEGDENLETLLSLIDGNIKYKINDVEQLVEYKKQLLKMIVDKCSITAPEDISNFPHAQLLTKITQRKATLPRVKVFTLNYDLLFEQAANYSGSIVLDGFSFTTPRTFSGRYFDYDIVQREKSRVKDEDNFISRLFHLYKLHGSLNWEKKGNKIEVDPATNNPLIVYPRDSKYENSYEQPFFEMMARFQQNLRKDNSVLLCIGYSFNDKHINAAIEEALNQNPGFQLAVINPDIDGDNVNFKKLIDESIRSERIIMIDEKFQDFTNYFPEIQTYNDTEPVAINIQNHG